MKYRLITLGMIVTMIFTGCGKTEKGDSRATVNSESSIEYEKPALEEEPSNATEETSEETVEETVEEENIADQYPDSSIPIYENTITAYCDEDKGEVVLKDVITGSHIKFTYNKERFSILAFEEHKVLMLDKTDPSITFYVKTTVDDVYPELHSYQTYLSQNFERTGATLTPGELVLGGYNMTFMNQYWTVRVLNGSSGNDQGCFTTLPDGSILMTSVIVRKGNTSLALEEGTAFYQDLIQSLELYTDGGYTEPKGDMVNAYYELPANGKKQYLDENGEELFSYYLEAYSNSIIIASVKKPCVIPEEIDGYPVTQSLCASIAEPGVVYPSSVCSLVCFSDRGSKITYGANGWVDGKVVMPNIKRIGSGVTVQVQDEVPLPDTVEYIEGEVISENVSSLILPKNLRSIGNQNTESTLKYIYFQEGDNPITIQQYAFGKLYNLEEVKLSENVIVLDEYAFFGCERLKEIQLPSNLKYLGSKAFAETGLSGTYVIPDSVLYLGNNVFPQAVTTLVVPDSVLYIGTVERGTKILTTEGSVAASTNFGQYVTVEIISEEEMEAYQSGILLAPDNSEESTEG